MKMLRAIAALAALFLPVPAFGQAQLGAGQVWGNSTAARAPAQSSTVTAILDRALGSTRGAIIERGASGWVTVGPGATAGLPWVSAGAGADPSYARLGLVGGGTGIDMTATGGASQFLKQNTLGGTPTVTQPDFADLSGRGTLAQLPQGIANSIFINPTGSTANMQNIAVPACANDGAHALVYVNGSGLQCATLATGGTVTSVTPGGGLVSSTTAACSQTAITAAGTISAAQCLNAQVGTSYAIADSDRGKIITASNAAAQAYTIAQAGAASNFQGGWYATIKNISTAQVGVVTITPTTSTINGAATYKIPPGQSAKIFSDGANYQVVATGTPATPPSGCAILATATATCSDGSAGANNGTYTPPTNAVWLEIEMIGGGGGGCGSGTTPGAAVAAGNTTFGTLTATGSGTCSMSAGGTGGSPTGSAAYLLKTGGSGSNGSGANLTVGGFGCSSYYGNAGAGGAAGAGAGVAAAANTGSGGGGGGVNTTVNGGGGGGCGGLIKAIFQAPLAATYSYAIGAGGTGGTAGTGGAAGGNGGSGYIQITPHFNY